MTEFTKLFKKMTSTNEPVVNIRQFKLSLGRYAVQFVENDQQDCHELLLCLLGAFQQQAFIGEIESLLKCPSCSRCNLKLDPFMTLSLPIPGATDKQIEVIDCIQKYCEEEQLDESETWHCNQCQEHVRAWKQFRLKKLHLC